MVRRGIEANPEVYLRENALARQWYIRESRPEEVCVTVTIRRVLSLLAVAVLAGPPAAATDPPAADEIASWIEALGSAQFAQREAATRSLVEAGPAALQPLREAIRGGDLEVSSRAIDIARAMLGGDDAEAVAAAEAFLQALAESDDVSVARMAEATLDFHALGMAEAARATLEALGAVITQGFTSAGQHGTHVILGAAWRGSPADLRLLTRVPRLLIVSLHGVKVDDAVVPALGRLRQVKRLELYGTGATDAQIETIQGKIPLTAIDVRKGGKLGVGGQPNPGPCLITQVQPGSAADKAGVQVGDIVTKVDGEAVANFEELTDRVGTRGPGEKVELEIQRSLPGAAVERISRTVELDAW